MSKIILSDKKGVREMIIFDDRNEKEMISWIEKKILNEDNSEIIVKQWIIDN
ncbi:MAG TPA: hypothetical protein VFY41_02485 [Nitrososphaeraceae archaeon]|nr:hypothetical protein [Nitrososphaeraceae archaeon]HEX6027733.1 hypothetical protein [Nitrososphaeraceae archaeon]